MIKNWAIVIGLVLGSVAVLSVCFVWIRRQTFGMGGAVLSLVGVILVGMSVWGKVKVEASEGGLTAEFETIKTQVNQVAEANTIVTEELEKAARNIDANRQQFSQLTQVLRERQSINQPQLEAIRRPILKVPRIDMDRLEKAKSLPVRR